MTLKTPQSKAASTNRNGQQLLKNNLDAIKDYIKSNDVDWVHINVGSPGTGKSTLSAFIGFYFDDGFSAERMALSGSEFRKKSVDLDPLNSVVYDEGISSLYSREAMTSETKNMIKFFEKCRYLNLFIQINLPDLAKLDKSLRPPSERVHSVARCVKQGWAHFYSQSKLNQISYENNTVDWPDPDFRFSFPKLEDTRPEFWEAYNEKKAADIQEMEKDDQPPENLQHKCNECGHEWKGKKENPARCVKCQSSKWDQ